jgi:hypothetical protein
MMAPRVFLEKKEFRIIYQDRCLISDFNHKKFPYVLAILFAYHFIFDISYPKCSLQVLGFFHEFCFKFEELHFNKTREFEELVNFIKN